MTERDAEIAEDLRTARQMILWGNSETAIVEVLDRALELLERQEG